MSRGGPNGWEATLMNPEGFLCRLPANSELLEVLRQGAELLISGKSGGVICGSSKEFDIGTSKLTGARFLVIPIVGVRWILTENLKSGHRSPINLTMNTDFVPTEFSSTEDKEEENIEEDPYESH
jgi:hypothetical protein